MKLNRFTQATPFLLAAMKKQRKEDDNQVKSPLGRYNRPTKQDPLKAYKRKQTLNLMIESIELNPLITTLLGTKIVLVSLALFLIASPLVQAGFWTFYFPNFLKPNGYKELRGMIEAVEADMNATKDNFADIQYFWTLMKQFDSLSADSMYPEESACSDVFPLFRDLAIEYAQIDYELYMKPMELYHDYLEESHATWYPEGAKSKTILPREWEQKIFEAELETKIIWYEKLANDEEYRNRREKMVNIWSSVKRSLDSSLACLYLRYSYRQVAEDINQTALDMNLKRMTQTMELLRKAYKRIDKFRESDKKAIQKIEEDMEKERRSEMKS